MAEHLCFDKHCKKPIPTNKFGCPFHWSKLTKNDQAIIWSAYRKYQSNKITLAMLRKIQKEVKDRYEEEKNL